MFMKMITIMTILISMLVHHVSVLWPQTLGINGGYQRWNTGGELNVMTDQSFQAFYDFNLGVNWSFQFLWKTGSMGMLTFAI